MRLLLAFSRLGGRQTLTAIANASGLPAPRAHRYLVSLVRAGMVERHESRGYTLGPAALEIGANALASVDALQLATAGMMELHDQVNQTVALMVWGRDGPVIVRTEDSRHLVSLRLRVGQPLPIMRSASGIMLAAHQPWGSVCSVLERELTEEGTAPPDIAAQLQRARKILAQARSQGISRIVGTLTPGITAFAAPVIDGTGQAVASISVIAPSAGLPKGLRSQVARMLQQTCAAVSARLGHSPQASRRRTYESDQERDH
jgi:DNA-binding IclR family transcriptional regulator